MKGAPGLEDFEAVVVPGLGDCPAIDDRGPLAVVTNLAGDPFVVPVKYLEEIR